MQMVQYVEAFLIDVTHLHFLIPVEVLILIHVELKARVALSAVAQASCQLLKLKVWRFQELAEIVAKFPDVEQTLEGIRLHSDLHRCGLGLKHAAM